MARGCIEIDSIQFMLGEFVCRLSDAQLGKLFRKINRAYNSGDHDWIKDLPFVRKVYPRHSTFYRRHIPVHIRREVLSSGPCVTCGTTEGLTVDHILALANGGTDQRSNLQPMCFPCNARKGARLQ